MAFTDAQYHAIEIGARVSSALSIVGSLFIIITFLYFRFFRKPITWLVFYTSFGNIANSIATSISIDGIKAEPTSALCQFQGVFIQWFIPADALWAFCMALNVYLTFFKGYDEHGLRALEWRYLVFCYGVPLLPAIIYLILDVSQHLGIYGHATIWCWVSLKWDWMRLAFFYAPVWGFICASLIMHARTLIHILKGRTDLRSFSGHRRFGRRRRGNPASTGNFFASGKFNEIAVVNEIQVTTETIGPDGVVIAEPKRSSVSSTVNSPTKEVTSVQDFPTPSSPTTAWPFSKAKTRVHDKDPATEFTAAVTTTSSNGGYQPRKVKGRGNAAAESYAKVAMLIFLALFVVWIPSTANRIYSFVRPDTPNFALNFISALVLPSQGFWNAIIYIFTSWRQCKYAIDVIRGRRNARSGSPIPSKRVGQPEQIQLRRPDRSRGEGATRDIVSRDIDEEMSIGEFMDAPAAGGSSRADSTTTLPLPREV